MLQTLIPLDGGYDSLAPTTERQLPSILSLSTRFENPPNNHNSSPTLTYQLKLELTRSSVSLQRNTQLRRTNDDQHL